MPTYPTTFSDIIGNEQVKNYLATAIEKKAVGHAFLFSGPSGIGKNLFAVAFAARLIASYDGEKGMDKIASGNHPDIHFLKPEGKVALHSIESLRRFSEEVNLPPYEASWKVFIIQDADRMYSYSANALLKTFEEPPPRTLIILLTSARRSLLPTILSRCRSIYFHPLASHLIEKYLVDSHQVEKKIAHSIGHSCEGSIGEALRILNQADTSIRSQLLDLLARRRLGSYRFLQKEIEKIVALIQQTKEAAQEEAKNQLQRSGFNDLSLTQKESLEKEIEGFGAIIQKEEVKILFHAFYSWYRDLELLSLGGPKRLLINKNFYSSLEQEVQRGESFSLADVREALDNAELALQRSTSLFICLETLFLKFNRL